MTQDRRKDDKHPDRPLDWSDTEALAGQEWKAPAAPQAVAGKVEVPKMSKTAIDAIVYECRQRGSDTTYDIVNAALALAASPSPVPAPQGQMDERASFEAAMPKGHPRDRNMPDGSYNSPFLHSAWIGWQARAALSAAPAERQEAEAGSDKAFLQWVHDRMRFVHGENEDYDYMHKLRAIIASIPADTATPNVCSVAAPSQQAVVGQSIDTPEFLRLAEEFAHEAACEQYDEAKYKAARAAIVAHIDQQRGAVAEAAKREALEEAAREIETNSQDFTRAEHAQSIRALIATPQAEQEQKQ